MRGWDCLILGTLLARALCATPIYHVSLLGNLGGVDIAPAGVNSSGQISGTAANAQGDYRAFLYDGAQIKDLGTAGGQQSRGGALNNSGQVAGTAYYDSGTGGVVWQGGSYTAIGGAGTWANAVNNSGQVAGAASYGGDTHATVAAGGAIQDLGTLPGGSWSSAYAINDQGQVVGYGDTSSGRFRAFVWSAEEGIEMLGTLGGSQSYAMAISGNGLIAGHSTAGNGYTHAFLWNGLVMTDLGTFGDGNSHAYGVNSAGDVVGYSDGSGFSGTHAFLYHQGGLLDLNSLISPVAGLELIEAYGINGAGQIAGAALWNNQEVLYRLDLINTFAPASSAGVPVIHNPEPGTLVLALIGFALLAVGISGRGKKPPRSL